MAEYEQFKSDHFDNLAKQFDWVCEQRLKSVHERLSNEQPPYPPPHTVTLARAVHVLAMRALADQHPAKRSRQISYTSNGRHGLHLYWQAVFRLNDVMNHAAKTGGLRFRDRLTATPIQEWRIPSKVEAAEWERCAIYPNDNRQAADRKAIEIMATANWPLLATHFDDNVVVSLAEFDAWAASTGIAEAGRVVALLEEAEEQTEKRMRMSDASSAAKERGEHFDPKMFEAEQKPAPATHTATPAPVVPVSDATTDPERRLALLRALGGTAKYSRGEWRFTGISALVESEKGRKRSTEKTIRDDLKEAAQNERDAGRAGFATGLGQR